MAPQSTTQLLLLCLLAPLPAASAPENPDQIAETNTKTTTSTTTTTTTTASTNTPSSPGALATLALPLKLLDKLKDFVKGLTGLVHNLAHPVDLAELGASLQSSLGKQLFDLFGALSRPVYLLLDTLFNPVHLWSVLTDPLGLLTILAAALKSMAALLLALTNPVALLASLATSPATLALLSQGLTTLAAIFLKAFLGGAIGLLGATGLAVAAHASHPLT